MVGDRHALLLSESAASVEDALRSAMAAASVSGLPLYRMMQYQFGWVDKDGLDSIGTPPFRLVGSLCVEAARSMDASVDPAHAAAAVEMFLGSVAVHEQMQSGDAGLPERPAIWWVWGPAQAINVGDGLHALARLSAMKLKNQGLDLTTTLAIVDALDELAMRFYEGQYVELTYQERIDITAAQYSSMVRSKRGALLGGACAVGAAVARADRQIASAFQRVGELLGEALQVRDDIDSLFGEAASAAEGRVLNKSKLYPVVDVLENGTLAQKRAVGTIYFKRVIEPLDLTELRRLLEDGGARDRSERRITELLGMVTNEISALPVGEEMQSRWRAIAEGLVGTT